MQHTDLRLVEVAKRFVTVGFQAAQAYEQEQAKLKLGEVLSPVRLCTVEGTRASLTALTHLRQLTDVHKKVFAKVAIAASGEFAAVLAELPEEAREERQIEIVVSVNKSLNAQADFYANRVRWIDAAENICRLIESRRETCTFTDAGVDFADDEDLASFGELLDVIEETHQIEVSAVQERVARVAVSMALLGSGNSK